MVTVQRSITVDRPADEVLRYLADFGHTTAWDPGTESCVRLDDGPVREGARWRNVSRFRGRRTRLDYRLERYGTDHLVFVGENGTVTATDDITVRPYGGGSVVDYRAHLGLKGFARLASPLVRREFERLADRTADRLPRVLADPGA
ncbi:SRPBCC family protein [Kitasatospora camelliae]|uniref:SRPBCC family protein n=1 Tax=Kitasatospora camelliae TaxID=3156397 RepID=A0AAU8JQR2_9ACTN